MNRERAETYLRLLAEAELRRAGTSSPGAIPGGSPRGQHSARLALVAQALSAVGSVSIDTADEILADFDAALATRPGTAGLPRVARMPSARPVRGPSAWPATDASAVSGLSVENGPQEAQHASWRVVPIGRMIQWREDCVAVELHLLAYAQTAGGARFTVVSRTGKSPGTCGPRPERKKQPLRRVPPFRQLTLTDDKGTSYHPKYSGRRETSGAEWVGVLDLHPDPPGEIHWLDLSVAPGEPVINIDLNPQTLPDIAVTPKVQSPGELLLGVIAARILTVAADFPQGSTEQLTAANPELLSHAPGRLGDIIAGLHAADALSPASPVPGQLAKLCASLGISGHGITESLAEDLPKPWLSMLTRYHRRSVYAVCAPGGSAAAAAILPELDSARIAVLGLHHGERGTILHILASGVTLEDDWKYIRGVRPLPNILIRDSSDRWHTTRTDSLSRPSDNGEIMLRLAITPPLEVGTAWIEIVAAGRLAEASTRLQLPRGTSDR